MRRSTLLTRATGVRIADTLPPTSVATCEWAADTLGSFPSSTGAIRSRCRTSCISAPWLAIRVRLGTASMRLPVVSTPAVRLGLRSAWDASVSTNSRPSWRDGGRRARRSFLYISSPIVTVLSETRPPAGPKDSAHRRTLRRKFPLLRRDRHIALFRTVQKTRLPHLAFSISQELWRVDRFCKKSLCVPKPRFCNIGDEVRQGQAAMQARLDRHLGEKAFNFAAQIGGFLFHRLRRSEHGLRRLLCFGGGAGHFAQHCDNQLCSVSGACYGQRLHLRGNYREAAACFAGARRLNGHVERQQIRLPGDVVDQVDDVADLLGGLRQCADILIGRARFADLEPYHVSRLFEPWSDLHY